MASRLDERSHSIPVLLDTWVISLHKRAESIDALAMMGFINGIVTLALLLGAYFLYLVASCKGEQSLVFWNVGFTGSVVAVFFAVRAGLFFYQYRLEWIAAMDQVDSALREILPRLSASDASRITEIAGSVKGNKVGIRVFVSEIEHFSSRHRRLNSTKGM